MALRALLIGVGLRGREWAQAFSHHPSWDLSAIADVDAARLDELGATYRVPPAERYTDAEAAINQADVDAVLVATPAERHAEVAQMALGAMMPTMVEKPFASSLSEASGLVGLAERDGTPLLVAQNYRYLRGQRAARDLVRSGALGTLHQFIAHYYRTPHEMTPSLARSSHAILWGMAVHHLDALRFLIGRDASRVTASTFTSNPSVLESSIHVLIEFEGGKKGVYTATYESSGHQFFEGGQEFYERLIGDQGTLHLFHRWLIHCPNGKMPRLVRRGARKQSEEMTLLDQFAAAISHRTPSECSGRDNLATMAILEACLRSSEMGQPVDPRELLNAVL